MLRELHISNLAVIADARIELAGGLNCFTGATGAGKSLVIGAIEVLLGLRSGSEMVRAGADEGRINGVFEVRDKGLLAEVERALDVSVTGDGGELLLTRRLYASGRSSISLNGQPITLGMLKTLGELLVDVHGQHDHQFLLRPANQLTVLDEFASLMELRQSYHEIWLKLAEARKRREDLAASRTLRQQQLELYRFQAEEIDGAELDSAEFEELQSRSSVLRNLEKLRKEAGAVHLALYEAEGAVLERLKMMAGVLSEMCILDTGLKDIAANVRNGTMQLEECAFDLSRYLDKLDLDPSEIAEVDERLNAIHRVLNKYGSTVEATLAYRQEIGAKIAELGKARDDLSEIERTIAPLSAELVKLGKKLSGARKAAGKKLSPLIEKELAELGMEKAKFAVQIESIEAGPEGNGATPSGIDSLEFVVRTNPGQPSQPLRKIASGGELSRIMLALKGILAQGDRVSVLVFDEIDANVGGRLGSVIGEKLRRLAGRHQVLCITHLPQIAAYAERHLTVRKQVEGKETHTTVRPMAGDERLAELAEMIGGQRVTETTRQQARELLEAAVPTSAKAPQKPAAARSGQK